MCTGSCWASTHAALRAPRCWLLLRRSSAATGLTIPLGGAFGELNFVADGLGVFLTAIATVVGGLAVLFSLVLFTAVYGALMGVAIYLFNRYAKSDPVKDAQPTGLY